MKHPETKMPNPSLKSAWNKFHQRVDKLYGTLADISRIAHTIEKLDPPKDDDDASFDRLLELGKVMAGANTLCTPRLRVLVTTLEELLDMEEDEGEPDPPADADTLEDEQLHTAQ
jgi:hypothetical protein